MTKEFKARVEKAKKQADERAKLKAEGKCQRCKKRDKRTTSGLSVCRACNRYIVKRNGGDPDRKVGRPSKYLAA